MNLYGKLIFTILIGLALSGCNLPFFSNKKMAALNITSTPKAAVFLDGDHVGNTPFYDEKLKVGDYAIKLVPEGGVGQAWEARVKLSPGILTVVSRELGENVEKSSGFVMTLESDESQQDKGSLLVVTSPDGALVSVDGEPKGFAPAAIEAIGPGDHVVLVSSPGYIEKSIKAQVVSGHKLTASVQLAKSNLPAATETKSEKTDTKPVAETAEAEEKILDEDLNAETQVELSQDLDPPYILVLDTPTGWLNVRKTPSTANDNILKRINPGEKYPYLKSNNSGWYEIELEDETGWVSSKYVKLVEK